MWTKESVDDRLLHIGSPYKHKCCYCGLNDTGLLDFPKSKNAEYDHDWIHSKCLKQLTLD